MSGSSIKRLTRIFNEVFTPEQRTVQGWRRFKKMYSSGEMKLTPKGTIK